MSEKEWSKEWSRSDYNCEPDRSGSESEGAIKTCPNGFSSEGKPSDEKIVSSLAGAREELGRLRKTFGSCDNIVSLALANVAALERRCAALEKKSQEAARSPEANEAVVQQIAALRKSLEDKSPQGTKSSSSFEKELVLVRPVKGVDKEGCLILGDPKLLRASALKS